MEAPLADGERAVNLGCGKIAWPGWIGVDLHGHAAVKADLLALPFDTNSIDRMAAIHVIEHLYYWEVDAVLREWHRVLKPDGTLVIECPDMQKVFNHIFLRMKKGEPPSPSFSWYALWGDPSYQDPAMVHKWGYCRPDIETLLLRAGFCQVEHEEARYHFPTRDLRVTARKERP